ncbi:hypothetical protein Syun_002384 [Stephania yunnanensis]|uniref:Pentatricopeptide repeat-containing protein n=1 Tax=Stephania yunnanensis TaxID=152371 RepID=A0AAP0Q8R0_9MAGN
MNFKASIHSKRSKVSKTDMNQKTQMRKSLRVGEDMNAIFAEITEIIGTQESIKVESIAKPVIEANRIKGLMGSEHFQCRPSVCRNAEESGRFEYATMPVSGEDQLGDLVENDVSPVVHRITGVIRGEDSKVSMEERLEKSGFEFDSEVVEKVLKRCFKVGGLGLRFFNWLKRKAGFRHTTETYNTMIYIAGEAREFDVVERLVREMEEESCRKDIKTWTILIASYGKGKMVGKALLLFEEMKKSGCDPDEKVYGLIVSVLCNAGKGEIALEFYREMVHKSMGIDLKLYILLLNCLSRLGDISAVQSVGDDMINVSQIPEQKVFSVILRSFCVAGKIREALELLHELKDRNVILDHENFEVLVKGLCKDSNVGDALELVNIMKHTRLVDEKVYGILISGYLRKNEISRAFELFDSVKESGCVPLVSTYTELMQHLFRLNEYERACKLYEEMLESGVEPDSVAVTAVVAGHVQHNRISEAWKAFEGMKNKGVIVVQKPYYVFIKELCKVSRPDEGLKILYDMRNSKIMIKDEIFRLVISSFEKKRDVESVKKAKHLWESSRHYAYRRNLADHHMLPSRMIERADNDFELDELKQDEDSYLIQKEANDVRSAKLIPKLYIEADLQNICRILLSSMDWASMEEVLGKCTISFTPELVLEVLRSCQLHGHAALRFFSWVDQQPGYKNTTETYNMAIKIAGCAKDFGHMRKLYHEMKRKRVVITSDTWIIMIMQYGRAGLTDIALRKFKESKAEGSTPTASTYKYLIVFLCGRKGRKVDEAIRIFHEMINAGHTPDKELAETYLHCLCEADRLSDIRRCIKSLCKCGFTMPLSYSLAVRALCRAGSLDSASALSNEIGEARFELDQYIYGSLVHGLLRLGRLEEALAKVDAMKQCGVNPTVHVYTSFIVHFFREKQIEKALETFKKMRDEGCEPTIVTYSSLIRGYMDTGMVRDAWDVFRRMKVKGPYPDFRTYSMFIFSLCKQSRSEEALQLIDEMINAGILASTVNFRTVFHGLNREGKCDLAHTVLQKKLALRSQRRFWT